MITGIPGRGPDEPDPSRAAPFRQYSLRREPASGRAAAPAARRGGARAAKPLSRKQVIALVVDARAAHAACVNRGAIPPETPFDSFRRAEIARATGGAASGLRDAVNHQFRDIRARFRDLAGDTAGAFADAMTSGAARAAAEEMRVKVWQACARWGLARAYADTIARARTRSASAPDGLSVDALVEGVREGDDGPARTLETVLYTIRNRGRSRAARKPGQD